MRDAREKGRYTGRTIRPVTGGRNVSLPGIGVWETWVSTQGCLLYKFRGERGWGNPPYPLQVPGVRVTGCLISPPAKTAILFLLNYSNLSYLIIYLGANRCVPHTQVHLLKPCAIRPLSGNSTMTTSHHSVPGLQHTTPRSARYSNPFPNLHKTPHHTWHREACHVIPVSNLPSWSPYCTTAAV